MRRNEGNCPCGECKVPRNWTDRQVRDCPATDMELTVLRRARRTTDPKKLAAMMPAWLKRELYKPPKPFQFVPDKAPVYPSISRKCVEPAKPMPDPFTNYKLLRAKTTAAYVAAYERAVGLRSFA